MRERLGLSTSRCSEAIAAAAAATAAALGESLAPVTVQVQRCIRSVI